MAPGENPAGVSYQMAMGIAKTMQFEQAYNRVQIALVGEMPAFLFN